MSITDESNEALVTASGSNQAQNLERYAFSISSTVKLHDVVGVSKDTLFRRRKELTLVTLKVDKQITSDSVKRLKRFTFLSVPVRKQVGQDILVVERLVFLDDDPCRAMQVVVHASVSH